MKKLPSYNFVHKKECFINPSKKIYKNGYQRLLNSYPDQLH